MEPNASSEHGSNRRPIPFPSLDFAVIRIDLTVTPIFTPALISLELELHTASPNPIGAYSEYTKAER